MAFKQRHSRCSTNNRQGRPLVLSSSGAGPRAGAALLAMSVGGGVLSYLFWNAGIAKLGPARAAIFMNLVPVASMVIAAFSGAPPNHAQLLGGALVIGAVTFSALSPGSAVAGTPGN